MKERETNLVSTLPVNQLFPGVFLLQTVILFCVIYYPGSNAHRSSLTPVKFLAGIDRLLRQGVYSAAYPLHEVRACKFHFLIHFSFNYVVYFAFNLTSYGIYYLKFRT